MKTSNKLVLSAAMAAIIPAASFADGTPEVSDVTMSQTSRNVVTITYRLSNGPAVVTLDIETNCVVNGETCWASIGGENIQNFKPNSDVFKKVGGKETYTIKWLPDLSWADHRIPEGGARAVVTAWALDNTPDYMVVDISEGAQPDTQQYYCSTNFLPGGLFGNDDYRTSKIVMRKIMAKNVKWTMGSINEDGRMAAREASHTVQLTNNYYIGVFELTQSQYTLARAASSTAKPSPSFRREEYRAMRPMEQISYNEIRAAGAADQAYSTSSCWPAEPGDDSLLKLLRNKTNIDFDLPTEAQWEFACRAGNGEGKWGNGAAYQNKTTDSNLPGRYKGNCEAAPASGHEPNADTSCGTAIVGSYAPNDWGLYDMHGNVYEWCLDWFADDVSTLSREDGVCISPVNVNLENPATPAIGSSNERIMRGGTYSLDAQYCRSAFRNSYRPHTRYQFLGVRLACRAGLK